MSIVSSVYTVAAAAQADGRFLVTETHTDNIGQVYICSYFGRLGADFAAIMSARAAMLAVEIAESEARSCIDRFGAFVLNYQTKAEFAARFREFYRQASREELARLAYWLVERIADGTFTDAQVQSAFGLSGAQYTALKGRATTLHDEWAAIQAATGE